MLNALYALWWMACTIHMEAGNQPFAGMVAIGHVIMNRAEARGVNTTVTIFAPKQFTCWDGSRANLSMCQPSYEAIAAASGAYFREALGLKDPTGGATHYLNPKLLGGNLPAWYDEKKVLYVVGDHHFLRAD